MQSKVVPCSCVKASAALATPTMRTSSLASRWLMLSSWRASSSTTSTWRRPCENFASSPFSAPISASRFTGLSA